MIVSETSYVAFIFFATILSVQKMYRKNRNLAEFTGQTDHHEPNFSFHLAIEMWRYLPSLNCDFDVKKTTANKRPDLIFHRRGTCDENFLVVEVKRCSNADVQEWECSADEEKIRNYWFADPLHYRYGLSLILDEEKFSFAFDLLERDTGANFRFGPKNIDDPELEYDFIDELLMDAARNGINVPRHGYGTTGRELEFFLFREFVYSLCKSRSLWN